MSMSNELRNIVIIFLVKTEIIVTVVTVSLGFFFGEQHNNEDYVVVLPILSISVCCNSLTICLVQFYIMATCM